MTKFRQDDGMNNEDDSNNDHRIFKYGQERARYTKKVKTLKDRRFEQPWKRSWKEGW